MLRRHAQFLKSLLFLFDLSVICLCWIGAYVIRFSGAVEPVTKGVPPLQDYLWLLVPIVIVWSLSFQAFNLYRPRRMGTHLGEFIDIAKANTLSVLILAASIGKRAGSTTDETTEGRSGGRNRRFRVARLRPAG